MGAFSSPPVAGCVFSDRSKPPRHSPGVWPPYAADKIVDKIVLVLLALLVKLRFTMKRIYTLIVLLGIVMGAVLTGCNQGSEAPKPADTNAAPAAPTAPAAPDSK